MGFGLSVSTVNTILYCRRFCECVEFYKGLGWACRAVKEWFFEFEVMPGVFLSVADEARTSVGSSAGQGLTVTFQVGDLDMIWRSLDEAGCGPEVIDEIWKARRFFLFDPEGHRLEFWSAAKT